MAKKFAKKLYNSPQWADVREIILRRDKYLCRNCGKPAEEVHHIEWLNEKNITNVNIALGEKNLISLCRNCHFAVHKKYTRMRSMLANKERSYSNSQKSYACGDGMRFNSEGVLEMTKIYIIAGSPLSGKTTYVLNHASPCDLVIDFDRIFQAVSVNKPYEKSPELTGVVFDIIDFLYSLVRSRKGKYENAYIITTQSMSRVETLAKELNAEVILMRATKADCLERLKNDPGGRDKAKWKEYIDQWFENNPPVSF